MIRVSLAAILCLTACQPAGTSSNNVAASAKEANSAVPTVTNTAAAPSTPSQNQATSAAVPASYDWHFLTHGGSGDLDFGDGDWAEGVKLLSFSCLPASGKADLAVIGGVTLRAGGETLTLAENASTPLTHPVLAAFRSSGEIILVDGSSERRLTAKADGRREVERFFTYCATGRESSGSR